MINTVLLGYSFLLVKGLYYPKTKISVQCRTGDQVFFCSYPIPHSPSN